MPILEIETIDRNSPIPLHYQLKQILLERIAAGEWQPDALIPSEQELQDAYGLSRTTVRQTLGELVAEGLLKRERGRGTFLAPPKMTHSPVAHKGLTDYLLSQGIEPGWRVLTAGHLSPREPAVKEAREQLQTSPTEGIYCLRRVRLAAEEPIGHHAAFLPASLAAEIDPASLTTGGSLSYLTHLTQMSGSRASRTIEAVSATEHDAGLLNMDVGCPVLMITRLVVSAAGAPIEYMQARYRGDRFKYQISD